MSAAKKPVVANWLPEDLIIEVFLRLPNRKPLLRFRCVSKGLRDLIDSRLFQNRWEVFHYSVSDPFTVFFTENNGGLFSIDFQSPDNLNSGEETQVLSIPYTINRRFIGSCRGLLCFGVYERGFGAPKRYDLFNPSNGTIQNCSDLNVPKLFNPNGYPYVPNDFVFGCGFDGFDKSKQRDDDDDDFKIVRFQVQYDVYGDVVVDVSRRVDVYSMRRDSWRQIKVEEFGVGYPASGNVSNDGRIGIWIQGETHWLWHPEIRNKRRKDNNRRGNGLYIVAFDLQSESSRRMMLPSQLAEEKDESIWLNDLSGRLCACVNKHDKDSQTSTTTIWVMEEYGVDISWSRLYNVVIPWPDRCGFIGYFPTLDGARLLCQTVIPGSWFWLNTQDGTKDYIQVYKLSRLQSYDFPGRHVTKSWICVGRSPLRLPYSDM